MTDVTKKLDMGAALGLVVALLGVAASPEFLDLLGPKVAGIVTLAGTLLAAVKGALFGKQG